MIGQRWDAPIEGPINFAEPDWQTHLRDEALRAGTMQSPAAVDCCVLARFIFADAAFRDRASVLGSLAGLEGSFDEDAGQ